MVIPGSRCLGGRRDRHGAARRKRLSCRSIYGRNSRRRPCTIGLCFRGRL